MTASSLPSGDTRGRANVGGTEADALRLRAGLCGDRADLRRTAPIGAEVQRLSRRETRSVLVSMAGSSASSREALRRQVKDIDVEVAAAAAEHQRQALAIRRELWRAIVSHAGRHLALLGGAHPLH